MSLESSQIFRAVDYESPDRDVEPVDVDEWKKTEGDIVLDADQLGSCIGIGFYDPCHKIGYLAHFRSLGNEDLDKQVRGFVQSAYDSLEEPFETLLGGTMSSTLNPGNETPSIQEGRQIVEDVVSEVIGSSCTYSWHDGYSPSRMVLDPDVGILYDEKRDEATGMNF